MKPDNLTHDERIARYRRIVAAKQAGQTLAQIGEAEHLGKERVRQIIRDGEPRPVGRPEKE